MSGFEVFQLSIAFLALSLSVWNYIHNNTSLHVNFLELQKFYWLMTNLSQSNEAENFFRTRGNDAFHTKIQVVNPSSHDIAFFDLCATDCDKKHKILIVTQKLFGIKKLTLKMLTTHEHDLFLPLDTYGVFPAHSHTLIDLVFVTLDTTCFDQVSSVTVSFSVSQMSWWRRIISFWGGSHHFRTHEKTLTLKGAKDSYLKVIAQDNGFTCIAKELDN